MTKAWGNQHESRKARILSLLDWARDNVRTAEEMGRAGFGPSDGARIQANRSARHWLSRARAEMNAAPASTRRRWRCGK